jgi:hypothetical protein
MAVNTISDFEVFDPVYHRILPDNITPDKDAVTGFYDSIAYHSGGTTERLAYALEAGLTTELRRGLKLDIFTRWVSLGRVTTSGNVVVSKTEWIATGEEPLGWPGSEFPADNVTSHYTGRQNSGMLSVLDIGVRLRLQF